MLPVDALRRKLQALAAIARDKASTDAEKANAATLKQRLEQQLRKAGAPAGDWSDTAFRLGRLVKDFGRSTTPAAPKGDWTDQAHRLGKAFRWASKKLGSD